jgi:Domain of unknown function (DUF1996)
VTRRRSRRVMESSVPAQRRKFAAPETGVVESQFAPHRLRRMLIAFGTSLALVLGTLGVFAVGSASASTGSELMVSLNPDRSHAVPLDGLTVQGDIYVFVRSSRGLRKVDFYLDDWRPDTAPARTETVRPFDLAGTAVDGKARPYDTTKLVDGSHTIKVVWTWRSGRTSSRRATFTVDNESATPAPTASTTSGSASATKPPSTSTSSATSTLPSASASNSASHSPTTTAHQHPTGTTTAGTTPTTAGTTPTTAGTTPTTVPVRDFDSEVADGVFQVLCNVSHFKADDPIVFPNRPGAAHMHSFYGNTSTDHASTTESLMGSRSTCGRNLETTDKSAYWVPSVYKKNADGTSTLVTNSSQISWVYYRRVGAANGPTVQPFPPGLRMIAGDATATSAQPLPIVKWLCGHGGPESPGIPNCTAPGMTGEAMMAKILFPSCWDGKNLDSPNHKSHMAYATYNGTCPSTHPVSLPEITMQAEYPGIYGGSSYYLASGGIYSMHADFFNGWDPQVQNALVAECLNIARDCIGITKEGTTLVKPAGSPGDPVPVIDITKY